MAINLKKKSNCDNCYESSSSPPLPHRVGNDNYTSAHIVPIALTWMNKKERYHKYSGEKITTKTKKSIESKRNRTIKNNQQLICFCWFVNGKRNKENETKKNWRKTKRCVMLSNTAIAIYCYLCQFWVSDAFAMKKKNCMEILN